MIFIAWLNAKCPQFLKSIFLFQTLTHDVLYLFHILACHPRDNIKNVLAGSQTSSWTFAGQQ